MATADTATQTTAIPDPTQTIPEAVAHPIAASTAPTDTGVTPRLPIATARTATAATHQDHAIPQDHTTGTAAAGHPDRAINAPNHLLTLERDPIYIVAQNPNTHLHHPDQVGVVEAQPR